MATIEDALHDLLSRGELPPECSATVLRQCSRLSPPADFLARGAELVRDPGCSLFRVVGDQSGCRTLGRRLGGPGSDAVWDSFAVSPERLEAIGRRVVLDLPDELPQPTTRKQIARLATGSRRLLDPGRPSGWWLMRAVARSIHGDAERETVTAHLSRCWAWDAWCMTPDNRYTKIWVIIQLLQLLSAEGEADGTFAAEAAVCPVSLEEFRAAGPTETFYSVHPCTLQPHPAGSLACAADTRSAFVRSSVGRHALDRRASCFDAARLLAP